MTIPARIAQTSAVNRPGDGPSQRKSLDTFIRQCQLTAGAWAHLDADGRFRMLLATLRHVPGRCPTDRSRAIVAGLIFEMVTRYLLDFPPENSWTRLRRHSTGRAASPAPNGPAGPTAELAPTLGPLSRQHVSNPHARMALEILVTESADPRLSLGTVAKAVGLSRWHLSRLLKRTTGVGFRSLLAGVRVAQAQNLLRATPLSIKEIAARIGYEHVSNLDRHFRQYNGTTPGRYRESVQRKTAASGASPVPFAGANRWQS